MKWDEKELRRFRLYERVCFDSYAKSNWSTFDLASDFKKTAFRTGTGELSEHEAHEDAFRTMQRTGYNQTRNDLNTLTSKIF